MYKIFWLENLNGRYHSEEPGVDGKRYYLREIG
jgi:hypothetical protein